MGVDERRNGVGFRLEGRRVVDVGLDVRLGRGGLFGAGGGPVRIPIRVGIRQSVTFLEL